MRPVIPQICGRTMRILVVPEYRSVVIIRVEIEAWAEAVRRMTKKWMYDTTTRRPALIGIHVEAAVFPARR